jgi:hypothetical protein
VALAWPAPSASPERPARATAPKIDDPADAVSPRDAGGRLVRDLRTACGVLGGLSVAIRIIELRAARRKEFISKSDRRKP